MNHAALILLVLGGAAAALFFGSVVAAGLGWVVPAALTTYVGALSGVLAANLGAVLGLSFVPNTSFQQAGFQFWNAPTTQALQIVAAYAYAGSLLAAVVFLLAARGKPVSSTIDDLCRAALGFFLAIVGVLLGRVA